MANTVISLKRSSTAAAAPTSLEFGELALNYADGKIYYKNTNSYIVEFAPGGGYSFGTVNANGTLLVSDAVNDVLTVVGGNNITIVGDAVNDKLTIGLTNDVIVPGVIYVRPTGGDEGGEIQLANAITNSVLSGNVVIDIYQNRLRFFEQSGTNRGAYIDLSIAGTGVSSNLLGGGTGSGTPGGSSSQVQFNDSGTFGGSANLTYNKTTYILTVGDSASNTSIANNGITFYDGSSLNNMGEIVALFNNLAMA